MDTNSTTPSSDATLFAGEAWFDPIEAGLRGRVRGFIEDLIEHELAAALGRGRYERRSREGAPASAPEVSAAGHRHGHRSRRLVGSFGAVEIAVPRARLVAADGVTSEWRSQALSRYARRTRQVEAPIAGAYLAGTNAGDKLFAFTRLPPGQWKSARTSNAIERLHEEFKRRIKTQTVLPSAGTAAMLFWALLASGQNSMRKINGWQTLAEPIDQPIDLAA